MRIVIEYKGGSGSGNYGHAGRPGKLGGSAPTSQQVAMSKLPFITVSEVKPADYTAFKQVMALDTPNLEAVLGKLNMTKQQAQALMKDARDFQMTHEQTINKYKDAAGNISPERQKVYDAYVNDKFNTAQALPEEHPTFFITGGLPGSGKSTMMKQDMYKDVVATSVTVDADEIRAYIAKADGINNIGKYASIYQEETDVVIQQLFKRALDARTSLVLDSSMKSANKFIKFIQAFKDRGYTTEIAFADVPLKVAMERAVSRFLTGGRFADPAYVLSNDHKNSASMQILKDMVDRYKIWSTNVPFGEQPILLEGR